MRDWMTLILTPQPDPPRIHGARTPAPTDAEPLAQLMFDSYRRTIDDAGETLDDARSEVAKLFRGDFGTFDIAASLVVAQDRGRSAADVADQSAPLASATLITRDRTKYATGEAFLAFSMTAPAVKRQGLARAGLLHAIHILHARGESRLHLVVTRANTPAVRLYESLGFVVRHSREH